MTYDPKSNRYCRAAVEGLLKLLGFPPPASVEDAVQSGRVVRHGADDFEILSDPNPPKRGDAAEAAGLKATFQAAAGGGSPSRGLEISAAREIAQNWRISVEITSSEAIFEDGSRLFFSGRNQ